MYIKPAHTTGPEDRKISSWNADGIDIDKEIEGNSVTTPKTSETYFWDYFSECRAWFLLGGCVISEIGPGIDLDQAAAPLLLA
jgi:hypothetical protein